MVLFESFFDAVASGEAGPLFMFLLLPFLLTPLVCGYVGRWKLLVQTVFSSLAIAALCFTGGIAMHSWSGLYLVTLAPGIVVSTLLGTVIAVPLGLIVTSRRKDFRSGFEETSE